MTTWTAPQRDRAAGVLLGTAAGDALGAPFEFGGPLGADVTVDVDDAVSAGSVWQTGEWTDDTAMAVAIAEVAARGADLRDEAAQSEIVARWCAWAHDPATKDVGVHTREVLAAAGRAGESAAAAGRRRWRCTGGTAEAAATVR